MGWHTHLQCADGLHSRHQRLLRLELEYTRPSARQCNPGEGECAAVACCGTCHFSPGSSFRSGPGLFCSACHALQNNRDAHAQLGRTRPCEVPQLVCEKKRGFFSELATGGCNGFYLLYQPIKAYQVLFILLIKQKKIDTNNLSRRPKLFMNSQLIIISSIQRRKKNRYSCTNNLSGRPELNMHS